MTDHRHTDLLRLQSAELTERTPFCPEDQAIAAYFDGRMAESDRLPMERHLADCRYCQARIGSLNALSEDCDTPAVPEVTLAAAKMLHRAPKRRQIRKSVNWATAAVLVLAVFTVMNIERFTSRDAEPEPVIDQRPAESLRQVRSIKRPESRLEVRVGNPGEAIAAGTQISWSEISGNIHYNIRILSDSGDLVWSGRVRNAGMIVDESLQLSAGEDYFLQVEAVMPDGGTVSSRYVSFQAADRR